MSTPFKVSARKFRKNQKWRLHLGSVITQGQRALWGNVVGWGQVALWPSISYILRGEILRDLHGGQTMAGKMRIGVEDIPVQFAELEDPRSAVNRRHPLESVIAIAVMASLVKVFKKLAPQMLWVRVC